MEWYDLADNPEGIRRLFSSPPALENIRIHEILLHQDGPRAEIRLDLSQYPENPPSKWEKAGFNRVQLVIMFFPVITLNIDGWTTNNIANISVFMDNEKRIHVQYNEKNCCSLNIICEYFRINAINGYLDAE